MKSVSHQTKLARKNGNSCAKDPSSTDGPEI